jgi:hypothetical protein
MFAISREGSGSHLMAYVMADRQHWDLDSLRFNVIGDIYGGLWALEHNEAQAFLWEKYTTFPFTEQQKCRRIGDVVTPWPCFVVAVRSEIAGQHEALLRSMCAIVNTKALEIKQGKDSAEMISWRYNLRQDQVAQWLSETDWNYKGIEYPLAFEKTVQYLLKLNLITQEEAGNWRDKLFV